VRHHTELTQDAVDLIGSEIDLAVAARTWTEAVTANTLLEIASVDAARGETDTARLLVAGQL
ncbi:MAG: hypothetical protein ACRD08_23335, partial [Acidimicrobiales bacterium]